MKTEGQIRQKLRQVIFRHKKKEIEKGLSRRPCNCVHNGFVDLKTPDKLHRIRKCEYQDDKVDYTKKVCDESVGGLRQARECPFFRCRNTPESLKRGFDKKVGIDGSPIDGALLGREYPDIMAMYWMLSSSKEEVDPVEFEDPEELSEDSLLFLDEGEEDDDDES